MAHRLKHLADLLGPPFTQLDLEPAVALVGRFAGGLEALDVAGKRSFAFQGDAAAKFVDQPLFRHSPHLDVVGLDGAVRRMGHLERQVAVVG